jgi:hypothetical protein
MPRKAARLELSREQILGFRRETSWLNERLPASAKSLRLAAWAGLQDSMPRAALLSIHARVKGCESNCWEHPSLVQLTKPHSANHPVQSRLRLCDSCRAAMPTTYYGPRIESSSCPTRSGVQSFGQPGFGPVRYSSTEISSEFGGGRQKRFPSTPGATFHLPIGRQSRPRWWRFLYQVSMGGLQSTGADNVQANRRY